MQAGLEYAEQAEKLVQEYYVMQRLGPHPYMVKVKGAGYVKRPGQASELCALALEYLNGGDIWSVAQYAPVAAVTL